jgi:S1-C subfamily serine protease
MKHLVLILLLICPATFTLAQSNSISQMEKAQSSIVTVRTVYMRPMKADGHLIMASYERLGAGVIIDSSGVIVTNTHTIVHAPRILVALANGKVYEASVLHIGPGDFSFIKINAAYKLRPIPWAESSKARIGESIMAYGRSPQNDQTMLGGMVTGLVQSQSSGIVELIELNLNLFKGDSGGPILDMQGRFLGMVMGKEKSEEHKSYAIASDKIRIEYLKYKQKM